MARRLLPTLLLSLTALLGLLPAAQAAPADPEPTAGPARPDDPYPTTEEIDRARSEVDRTAASVTAIEAGLTAARAELDRAGRSAEQAVEAYNGAQLALARARTEEAAAGRRATAAEAERSEAAADAAQLAAETYRQGAGAELSALNALLGARGPREAGDRAAVVGVASERTRQILDAATSTAAAANRASAAARTATEAAEKAATEVGAAKASAEARLAAQQDAVLAADRRREQLLTDLAAARHTTVDLERRHREALEEITTREAEAAARAAAEQAAAKATQAAPPADRPWSAEGAAAAIDFARSKIGLPYIWGGEGPAGYDCSGLTMMAWREGGRQLNHFAADQYAQSTPISYRQLRPGDLVFWTHTGRAADIYHVGLYIGDDQMIEAPRAGRPVKQASLWIMGTPDFYARP
ncbi:cell wall-associated NlpC family hydrolase [Kitasatospora sp. MAA19]|uniref:C40 family peptidase n=1 Tax=unclassified Kitasatospora TaxID=2633591 RepID=UPI002475B6E8|nr:C40 family peptidase [Kitasatospora sp. MAA19]MDH6704853.1 cell wall-associated NlpC family hydrolase [Kitasatospora sp. MAA19]